MPRHGFVRVAAAAPTLRVADCAANAAQILAAVRTAAQQNVEILVFPELCLTGYTCADLFAQSVLIESAYRQLMQVVREAADSYGGVFIVGLPLLVDDLLFNCAAVCGGGAVLGIVPKTHLANYKEFYERRWFAPAALAVSQEVELAGEGVPFGTDLLFESSDVPGLSLGVEICEDLWVPLPPSSWHALHGATLLCNLSASNEVIGKAAYRRGLVLNQSGRCLAAYVYASSAAGESTTDLVFSGHCMTAENGTMLVESHRLAPATPLLVTEIDVDRLIHDRHAQGSFGEGRGLPGARRDYRVVGFEFGPGVHTAPFRLTRFVDPHPFVPKAVDQLHERCRDIFGMQVAGLAKRLDHVGKPAVSIGVSGGLDSTLALIVACKSMDRLGLPRGQVRALTMPGFGTTKRTRENALALMQHLGVSGRTIDIRSLCLEEMRALGHKPFGIDLAGLDVEGFAAQLQRLPKDRRTDVVFENVQARMRTNLLMNAGFVVGTGDLSELALGWCTYNGDHMSMYNPNFSIPKTLVKFLVRWAAEHEFDGEARRVLLDVVATAISPELLPVGEDEAGQSTEETIGPYELHDFFLFHFLRYGAPPAKILFLADHAAFDVRRSAEECKRWLRVFLERFFANQFKRSCLPDGPKVGTISLSPRGDWRMPSDAAARAWLDALADSRGSAPSAAHG